MLSYYPCPRRKPLFLAKLLLLFLCTCTAVFLVRHYSTAVKTRLNLPLVQSEAHSPNPRVIPPLAGSSDDIAAIKPPTAVQHRDLNPVSSSSADVPEAARVIQRPKPQRSDIRPISVFNDLERSRLDRQIDRDLELIDPALGRGGESAQLHDARLLALAERLMKIEAFNTVISDRLSPNRSVPDTRSPRCFDRHYKLSTLPSASVIIIFTNEAYSALVRTIHSVINTTPPQLLHEIILVDDFSDRVELGPKLERYIERFFNNKPTHTGAPGPGSLVRLVRLGRRSGLIRARLAGARLAGAKVLVFLDSHCECGVQWLEPLLQRISENRSAVLTPIIDVINDKTLEYHHSNGEFFQVGGFTWSGHFTWINVPQQEVERRGTPADPTRSPTMAGGLFAIDRQYFWESGSYDENMDVWGGENLEMSFRIWMCGGTIETVPCSRVGHIFRDFHPYTFPGNRDTHGLNTARLAEVWMDEYKRLFYLHRPDLKEADIGSVEERRKFRRRKMCHSFRWYLENVLPEKFIPDENVLAFGKVTSDLVQPPLCLDNMQHSEDNIYNVGVYYCHNFMSTSQLFSLSRSGQLRREETCAHVSVSGAQPRQRHRERESRHGERESRVWMNKCDGSETEQWYYSQGMLRHVSSGLCLDRAGLSSGDDVTVSTCTGVTSQRWRFVRS